MIFILLLIQISIADKEFVSYQNRQKFVKFKPNQCYYYDGMSVKVEEQNGQAKLTYFNSHDCSGTSVTENSSSKLIQLMKLYSQNFEYIDSPSYIASISFFDEQKCPNKNNIIAEYYNSKCLNMEFSSMRYFVTDLKWIVELTYSDNQCKKVKYRELLYKCDMCTNNLSCHCSGTNSLMILFIVTLLFISIF